MLTLTAGAFMVDITEHLYNLDKMFQWHKKLSHRIMTARVQIKAHVVGDEAGKW